ncbi:timeless protein-domain-containing protein [Cunninghamella echinulata]|nr:timeless protein-domain-containing protein [Cunninghamella echinulata]
MAYEPSEDELHTRKLIINSCSALGGLEDRETDHGTTERIYCVGDEALACLKDLKRIIRADEIFTRKVLIELNVIETDLIPIILLHSSLSSPISERFILASIEIIVPLTWPIQHNPEGLDPELEQNILQYYQKIKMQLLEKGIFEAALRVLLKSLRIPYRERSSRDQSIIRLILYFWRNLTAISDPKVTSMASEEQILLSTLQALLLVRLHESNVLELLLTMASTMDTSEAGEYNVILLEILFYLLEHANAREIFMTKKITPVTSNANKYKNTSSKLSTMLHSENNNKRLKTLHTPSRHNRFGGSYILEGWDGGKRVSHKQHAGYADLDQLIGIRDKNRRGQKRKQMDEVGTHDAYSSQSSRLCLKQFAKSFLETCFNSFYSILYKDMQREDKKIIERDHARFYYTKKWFLEYISYEILETMSIEEKKKKQQENINSNNNKQTVLSSSSNPSSITNDQLILPGSTQHNHHLMEQSTTSQEKEDVNNNNSNKNNGQDENVNLDENKQPSNFHLVANAMELSMFWTCMRRIRICLEDKIWYDAQITADCLRQMLVLLNIMNRSSEQEYREVADYIQSNIYHEQETLDIFPDLIKAYRNQSYEYIEVTVQLIYTLLKMLESYCKNQTVLFIRKKKNGKKPKKKVTGEENDLDGDNNNEDDDDDNANSEEDERDRRIAYKEHVFAFENFEKKFATYDTIRVCCILLEQYKTLKPETLRSITGLFHRIMVKRKIEHLFWKLPTLDLFNRILIDYHFVPKSSAFDELHQFIVYVVRQFFKKAEEYPLLFIETIFKIEPCRINTND